MNRITRRRFLRDAALAAAALPAGLGIEPRPAQAAAPGIEVSVAQGTNDDTPEAMLKTALAGLGGIERFVKPGQVVAIKPNATWAFRPHTSSATDPEILKALIQLVKAAGAKRILVVDHCSIDPGTAEALRANGLGKVVEEMGVEGIFPDRFNAAQSVYTKVDIPKGKDFKKLGVIKAAVEADVRINLALAKSHNVTKMSMCMKHMMGLLEVPQNLHTSIEQGIADINQPSPIQAQLHILEAIRVRWPYANGQRVCAGPETDLIAPNIIKRMNTVLAGVDPVLMDAYGCIHFFNYQPEELTHLLRAFESGVGQIDVETATREGRLRVFQAGQPIPTAAPTSAGAGTPTGAGSPSPSPTPSLTASPTQTGAAQQSVAAQPTSAATQTPRPTATSLPAELSGVQIPGAAAADTTQACQAEVVSPKNFLNTALIPAAAIVLGLGLVASRRLKSSDPGEPDDQSAD